MYKYYNILYNSENDEKSDDIMIKDFIIVTGTADDNRGPCYRAFRFLMSLNCDVKWNVKYNLRFEDIKDRKHKYTNDITLHLYDCLIDFKKFRNIEKEKLYQF